VPLDRALPTEPPSPAAAPGPLALREPPPAPRSAPVEPSRAVAEPAGSSTVASAPDGGDRHEGAPRAGDHGGIGSSGATGSGGGIAGSGAGSAATGGGRGSAGDAAGLGLGAREGSVLALAIPGDGSGIGGEYQGYARLLGRRVQEALVYPPAALRRRLTGSVDLRVTVDATGAITDVALATSSTHRMLDEAAVHAAREVGRVPFPPDLAPRPLRIPVPVRFDVRVVR
jgi:protein TonB